MERVIVALWEPEDLDAWTADADMVSLAVVDQPFAADPVDAVLAFGPETGVPLGVARRVEVWRVAVHRPMVWDRTWPAGETAPGVKMVSFMRRAASTTHEQFAEHWVERHAPLARRHHIGLWNYTQNVVVEALTPGGADIDGIAELHFRSRDDYDTKFFDDDAGRAAIMEDVKRFMAKPGPETSLMTELTRR